MSELKVADFEPPAAYVYKIIKNVLPENMIMTKEARTAIVRAAGIFIFYITHGANDFCRESKRSTIYTADVINSLKELGFEDFEESLEEFLDAYRKETEDQKSSNKGSTAGQDHMDIDELNFTEEDANASERK
eukprot:gene12123-8668_t